MLNDEYAKVRCWEGERSIIKIITATEMKWIITSYRPFKICFKNLSQNLSPLTDIQYTPTTYQSQATAISKTTVNIQSCMYLPLIIIIMFWIVKVGKCIPSALNSFRFGLTVHIFFFLVKLKKSGDAFVCICCWYT